MARMGRGAVSLSVSSVKSVVSPGSAVAALLDTLPAPGTDVSDEEVARRERELESCAVVAISHEEFVRRVTKARGR